LHLRVLPLTKTIVATQVRLPDPRISTADSLAGEGRVVEALALLEHVARDGDASVDLMRRLASLRRVKGDLDGALAAIEAVLAASPLDFLGLLFRASLLEQRGDIGAGEAFGRALAQLPPQDPPASLRPAIEHARSVYAAHQARLERHLETAAAVGTKGLDPAERRKVDRFITNISRRTRMWHSEATHFHFPQLREQEYHDREDFPWLEQWEAAIDDITEEFHVAAKAESAQRVPYLDYGEHEPLAQWAPLNRKLEWTAIHLIKQGRVIEANASLCPRTMALLEQFPQPHIPGCGANAMFSLLAPRTSIPPHVGVANFRLVAHLPLIVPDDCWFRVGAETREWKRGEAFVFDDSIEHEAANGSDELRVVMIIDCWHPDLTPAEREAIARIVGQSTWEVGGL
jgi:aspartyl/asparaginyl beta-hydroxylase (cupin superfamily)